MDFKKLNEDLQQFIEGVKLYNIIKFGPEGDELVAEDLTDIEVIKFARNIVKEFNNTCEREECVPLPTTLEDAKEILDGHNYTCGLV